MSASARDDCELYERGIQKLIAVVRRMHEAEKAKLGSPTPQRKKLAGLAKDLNSLADELVPLLDLEAFHDSRGQHGETIGPDGWVVEQQTDWPSYAAILFGMRRLAESALEAAEGLPDSRARSALDFAARGLLHLRYAYELPVTLYDNGPAVVELERVCKAAGKHLSRKTLNHALRQSQQNFDKHDMGIEFSQLFQ